MNHLKYAESLDHFFRQVSENSMNRRARENLTYLPVLNYTEPWMGNTQIITMNSTAEAGMPHTREPNIICMPLYWKEGSIVETVKHELVHIDQRNRPEAWVKWAVGEGWTRVEEAQIPERWLRQCRLNPDTMAYRFWAYRGRWVPLPLYERADRPALRDVRVRWWDMKTGELLHETPAEIRGLVDGITHPEHPFEIAAYRGIQI